MVCRAALPFEGLIHAPPVSRSRPLCWWTAFAMISADVDVARRSQDDHRAYPAIVSEVSDSTRRVSRSCETGLWDALHRDLGRQIVSPVTVLKAETRPSRLVRAVTRRIRRAALLRLVQCEHVWRWEHRAPFRGEAGGRPFAAATQGSCRSCSSRRGRVAFCKLEHASSAATRSAGS